MFRAPMAPLALAASAWLLLHAPVSAIEWTSFEGTARGFPVLRDLNGTRLADGEFSQWLEGERLHVVITYTFDRGRRIEERVVFRQRPQLMQDTWSWREQRNGRTYRQYAVDFRSGRATAAAQDEGDVKRWDETLDDISNGQTFAGFGFTLAIKALRARLVRGEHVMLRAVGFAPKPQSVSVELSYGGRDRIRMSNRTLAADRFTVHPKLPFIAKLFVQVPDATIWLTTPPAGFLRWEGPLAEPDDPIIRVDLLPGTQSGPAVPVGTSGVR